MQEMLVRGHRYTLRSDALHDADLRGAFFALAQEVFGLDFRPWHEKGWWGERYQPVCLLEEGRLVANVSINPIPFIQDGQRRLFLQLGTVMTKEDKRGMGLAAALIRHVLALWKDKCDMVYLFANDSVLDFYPRFGFAPANETSHTLQSAQASPLSLRKADMANEADRQRLFECIAHAQPLSRLAMDDNLGLLMFYLDAFNRDDVYFIEGHAHAAAVFTEEEGQPALLDLFSPVALDLPLLCAAFAPAKPFSLGFAPLAAPEIQTQFPLREDDSSLFILDPKKLWDGSLRFPALSHA